MQILWKLGIPVRNVGCVEEMALSDVSDGFRKKLFFGLVAEINRLFTNALAGQLCQGWCLDLSALLPVFVHAVQPIGKPGATDLEKGQPKFGKAYRHPLKDHAGKLNENAD